MIYRLTLFTGKMELFCGSGQNGYSDGLRTSARFGYTVAVVRDPHSAIGYFLAEWTSIRYLDDVTNQVSLIAGGAAGDAADGIGSHARFEQIDSLLVTSDSLTLWCAEVTRRLAQIDRKTLAVTTCAGISIHGLVWDRATVRPDSAFYGITYDGELGRFDTATQYLQTFPALRGLRIRYQKIVCTPTGHVLFAKPRDQQTVLWVFDPVSSLLEEISDVSMDVTSALLLIESTRTLITSSYSLYISTLPAYLFRLPRCCDRDL